MNSRRLRHNLPGLEKLALAAGVLVLVLGFQLWLSASNPPGFHHDEAAFALNAYTIAHHLRDQDGAQLPMVFPSFGDYKSALFSYVMAPVFLIAGASDGSARAVATMFGIAAIALIAWIAYRRAGPAVAVGAGALAGLTPWLFQLGRVAYDTSMFPFAVAAVVLAVDLWSRDPATWWRRVVVALALAFMTYGYAAGRLLGPLLAVTLLTFATRSKLKSIAITWCLYGIALIPLLVYRIRHPRGLTARYDATTFLTSGSSFHDGKQAAWNYIRDIDPVHWVYAGSSKPYIDVTGVGEILGATLVLAALGAVVIVRRRPIDRFWLFVLIGYLLSPVPAALTVDRYDDLRLSAMPAFLALLTIPGLALVLRFRPLAKRLAIAAVAVAALGQWSYFVQVYSHNGESSRHVLFESDVPALLKTAFAGGRSVYIDYDDSHARTMAGWYAVTHHIPLSRVVRLSDGGIPPNGSMVFGLTQSCDYVCPRLATADAYWTARAEGPEATG